MRNASLFRRAVCSCLLFLPLAPLTFVGCGGSEQKTGEVVAVPPQQTEAKNAMEDFMNKKGAAPKK